MGVSVPLRTREHHSCCEPTGGQAQTRHARRQRRRGAGRDRSDLVRGEQLDRDRRHDSSPWKWINEISPRTSTSARWGCLVERGELDEAERALEQAGVGPKLPVLAHINAGFHARGLLRVAQGRDEEALADLSEYGARQATCMVSNAAVPWRIDAARALLRLGRPDEAEPLLEEHDAAAARWGTAAANGIALQGRAAATGGQAQIALLQAAHELLAQSPSRLDYARVLLDLASALRRAGQRRDAQRRLGEAVALARRCGATALATRTNDELGVLSVRPRRQQFVLDGLGSDEQRLRDREPRLRGARWHRLDRRARPLRQRPARWRPRAAAEPRAPPEQLNISRL